VENHRPYKPIIINTIDHNISLRAQFFIYLPSKLKKKTFEIFRQHCISIIQIDAKTRLHNYVDRQLCGFYLIIGNDSPILFKLIYDKIKRDHIRLTLFDNLNAIINIFTFPHNEIHNLRKQCRTGNFVDVNFFDIWSFFFIHLRPN
jgi:hypothetical protein